MPVTAVALALMTSVSFTQDKKVVATKEAPQAIGPYSQATRAGGFRFYCGQIAIDPATGKLIEGDIKAQTERVLKTFLLFLRQRAAPMGSGMVLAPRVGTSRPISYFRCLTIAGIT